MHIHVNGISLFVDIEGAGLVPDGLVMRQKPTLIPVHGGPGADHSLYKPAFSGLSDICQIVYYDHRGCGRSEDGPRESWTLAQWGDDLKALCDTLGIEKPIVLGTSFGGFVAQAYATRHPGHAGKLILVTTAAKVDFEAIYAAFERIGGAQAGAIARAYWSAPSPETRPAYLETCVPLYSARPKQGPVEWLSRAINRNDTGMRFNDLVLVPSYVVDELSKIVGRKSLLGYNHDRRGGHQSNGRKILGRIIFQVGVLSGRGTMGSHLTHHDGVAICLGLRTTRDPDCTAGSSDVLHDDRLAESPGHVLADNADDSVARSTGRERNDHGDQALREGGSRGHGAGNKR